jgi:hypothetical protein
MSSEPGMIPMTQFERTRMLYENSILIFFMMFEICVCTCIYDAMRTMHKYGGGDCNFHDHNPL